MTIGCIGHDGDCCVNRDADMRAAIEKAVAEEREACAKVCDAFAKKCNPQTSIEAGCMLQAYNYAGKAIRARVTKEKK